MHFFFFRLEKVKISKGHKQSSDMIDLKEPEIKARRDLVLDGVTIRNQIIMQQENDCQAEQDKF